MLSRACVSYNSWEEIAELHISTGWSDFKRAIPSDQLWSLYITDIISTKDPYIVLDRIPFMKCKNLLKRVYTLYREEIRILKNFMGYALAYSTDQTPYQISQLGKHIKIRKEGIARADTYIQALNRADRKILIKDAIFPSANKVPESIHRNMVYLNIALYKENEKPLGGYEPD